MVVAGEIYKIARREREGEWAMVDVWFRPLGAECGRPIPANNKIGDGHKSAYEISRVTRTQWVRTGLADHPTQMETPPQQMWFGSSTTQSPT